MPTMRARNTLHTPPFAVVPGKSGTQAMTRPRRAPYRLPGYSLLGWRHSRAQRIAAFIALCVGGGLAYVYYVWYPRSGDVSPDSVYGYGFAITGTLLLLAVGVGYAARKRWRHHWSGRLHTMLAWHMVGAVLGLVLIFMHAAGNFNPRTGTYALYGLIAVVISGIIGRALDRLCPWLAARAALRVLTASGEERLDDLERQLVAMLNPKRTRRSVDPRPRPPTTPWDIGYYDLDPDVELIPALLGQGTGHSAGGVASITSNSPGVQSTSPTGVQRQAQAIQAAMAREHFYIQVVRTWRRVHILVSLIFLGLLVWHLVYAATLLMNTW